MSLCFFLFYWTSKKESLSGISETGENGQVKSTGQNYGENKLQICNLPEKLMKDLKMDQYDNWMFSVKNY